MKSLYYFDLFSGNPLTLICKVEVSEDILIKHNLQDRQVVSKAFVTEVLKIDI